MYNNQTTEKKRRKEHTRIHTRESWMQLKRTINRTSKPNARNKTSKLNIMWVRSPRLWRVCARFILYFSFFPIFFWLRVRFEHVIGSARTSCLHSSIVVKLLLFIIIMIFFSKLAFGSAHYVAFILLHDSSVSCARPVRSLEPATNERTNHRRIDTTDEEKEKKWTTRETVAVAMQQWLCLKM